MPYNLSVRALLLLGAVLCSLIFTSSMGLAQDNAGAEKDSKAVEILGALAALLQSQEEKKLSFEELKKKLDTAEEADKKQLQDELDAVQGELDKLSEQFQALATGGAAAKFSSSSDTEMDLRKDFEQLLQPLVVMLKVATEDSRQIEILKHERLVLNSQFESAASALDGIRLLQENNDKPELTPQLAALEERWLQHYKETRSLMTSLESQLEALQKKRQQSVGRTGAAFTDFISDRAISLFLGVGAMVGIFIVMQLAMQAFLRLVLKRRRGNRTFRIRLAELFYHLVVVCISIGAMLYVFNARDDWLLLALSTLFLLAFGWVLVKMVPSIIEQLTLFLNLGAVQEGERIVFNDIPWLVEDLDYYTVLRNPSLTGGSITLPIRELIGQHSRDLSEDEEWFPCAEGDWVRLSDGHTGQVMIQSPEMVQMRLLGGAIANYTTGNFLDQNAVNLSRNFRVEVNFGVDYSHQAIATTEIPEKLKAYVRDGLVQIMDSEDLIDVHVDFLNAGDSSLDYEVEADVSGRSAHLHEDIERAMARLLVEACNDNGWTIPFPQLTVHRA